MYKLFGIFKNFLKWRYLFLIFAFSFLLLVPCYNHFPRIVIKEIISIFGQSGFTSYVAFGSVEGSAAVSFASKSRLTFVSWRTRAA